MEKLNSTFLVGCLISLVFCINAGSIPDTSQTVKLILALFSVMSICFIVAGLTKPEDVELGEVSPKNSPNIAVFGRYAGAFLGVLGFCAAGWGVSGAIV